MYKKPFTCQFFGPDIVFADVWFINFATTANILFARNVPNLYILSNFNIVKNYQCSLVQQNARCLVAERDKID